ncbi:hypothetical protein BGZ60DRAFT_395034 [Tricladium varicosporioides]|nr:hypothetical protein BGZ60DRAFT_395034 [Hymenoscyphus varicosporioides]
MPSLLDLPREIRDKILSSVISTPTAPPKDHSVIVERAELHSPCSNGWYPDKGVKYVTRMNRIEAIPTLLVNSQLYAETMAAIKTLPTKHIYQLDILIVGGSELWPTWVSVPALTNRVDKVYTTFRIDHTGELRYRLFTLGCGGPPSIVWSLLSLLDRFLNVGPVINPVHKASGDISVNILEIDVQTPDIQDSLFIPDDQYHDIMLSFTRSLRERTSPKLVGVIHPTTFMEIIKSYLKYLLYMNHEAADFGPILYERVGVLRLMIDGEFNCEWDMAEELKNLTFKGDVNYTKTYKNIPREERPKIFEEWKARAYKIRQRAGLNVIAHGSVQD